MPGDFSTESAFFKLLELAAFHLFLFLLGDADLISDLQFAGFFLVAVFQDKIATINRFYGAFELCIADAHRCQRKTNNQSQRK